MTSTDLRHVVIARAAGPDADSQSAAIKLSFAREPECGWEKERQVAEDMARAAYQEAFGEPPARSGAGGPLPFLAEEDGDGE